MSKHHHLTKLPAYGSWSNMLQRCTNPKAINYAIYGGRGITVCERWRDVRNFFEDMGDRPTPLHRIDRIDADGNYEPGNCRWVTAKENSRNRRDIAVVIYEGTEYCRTELAEKFGINPCTLRDRLKRGWPISEALTRKADTSASLEASWAKGRFNRVPPVA